MTARGLGSRGGGDEHDEHGVVAAAVTGIEGEESGSRTLYRYLGEPLLLGQGPVPPFAVYEQPRTLSLVFSTFNVAVKVDETPERVDSFGLVLRPDEDKRAHCTFFQSALSGDNAGGAVASPGGSLAPHCRIDVVQMPQPESIPIAAANCLHLARCCRVRSTGPSTSCARAYTRT